jgi:muconate cycloisomerase
MLTKAQNTRADLAHARLIIRRVDAIPVALPLKAPMTMSGVTIATAENLLVRIEAKSGAVGWGEAASAPTMTGDTLGGLVAAVRDHRRRSHRPGMRSRARTSAASARALVGNTGAHSAVRWRLISPAACSTGG